MKNYQLVKFIHIISLLMVCIFCSGCMQDMSSDYLAACGSYSIPGMFCYEVKGGSYKCTVLEEDSMGRILYEYTTFNTLTEREETATIICQQYGGRYVYFYEDQCCLLGTAQTPNVALLKEANDWDKPLDHDKMSRRKVTITFDGFLTVDTNVNYKDSRSACCKELGIQHDQIKDLYFSDADGAGNSLYILEIERNGSKECYLALFDAAGSVALRKIEDHQLMMQELAEFKRENNWVFGY